MPTTEQDLRVNLFDLVASLGKAIDMMSAELASHHLKVAYLAFRIGQALNLAAEELSRLAVAGFLHDIGAFSLDERLHLMEFEDSRPGDHSRAGYLLLKDFRPFQEIAEAIRFHHVPWRDGQGATEDGVAVPRDSHIVHLADRVSVLVVKDKPILSQVDRICAHIAKRKGSVFVPEFVDAFLDIAPKDYVWLELVSDGIEYILQKGMRARFSELGVDDLVSFSRLLCRIIDFKSPFTATHSGGVASVAVAMAQKAGFSEFERRLIEISAYLHDLGKLAIPAEILEKPGKLTNEEWQVMRTHVFYTYKILEPIEVLRTVTAWSSLHQERLNGSGYPFRCQAADLSPGSRIMAVADVFVALTEDRPYRKGMDKETTLTVLEGMADLGELDVELVGVVQNHFEEINEVRAQAQESARREYHQFRASL